MEHRENKEDLLSSLREARQKPNQGVNEKPKQTKPTTSKKEESVKVGKLTDKGVFVKMYLPLFQCGIAEDIGMEGIGLLVTIASYMKKNGEAYPTQRQLAKRLGTSTNRVNRQVRKLIDYRYNGKPIITREFRKNDRGKENSVYYIQPISQLTIFEGKREEVIPSKN